MSINKKVKEKFKSMLLFFNDLFSQKVFYNNLPTKITNNVDTIIV